MDSDDEPLAGRVTRAEAVKATTDVLLAHPLQDPSPAPNQHAGASGTQPENGLGAGEAHAKAGGDGPAKPKPKPTAAKDSEPPKATQQAKDREPKVKKEYEMPGQTKDTPPETDPLRKFYASLYEQRPDSEMAKKWCLTYGLLPLEVAEELAVTLKKSGALRDREKATPTKAASRPAPKSDARPRAPTQKRASVPPVRKKVAATYSDADDSDDDVPLAKKAKANGGPSAPATRRGNGKKDIAFADGGLDTDSESDDDDLPLAARAKAGQ